MKWAKENEASIVDLGSPLGKTKRIDPKGISDAKNEITAYTIVQAESHEAAAELFANASAFYGLPGSVGRGHGMSADFPKFSKNLGHPYASSRTRVRWVRPRDK